MNLKQALGIADQRHDKGAQQMSNQELGPDDLRKSIDSLDGMELPHGHALILKVHADAWESQLAAARVRIAGLEKEATAYREAMTLRPMESAPRDGSQFVALIHRGDDWSGVDDPEGPKWHCCYYHQDRYGEALMMQQKPTNYRCLGWLPLPTPINEGE